jgi:glucans biosynthesis protein C
VKQPAGMRPSRPLGAPPAAWQWTLALALGLGTFAMRLVQPIGTQVLNMQLSFFVRYVVFFICGLYAERQGWLLPLSVCAADW